MGNGEVSLLGHARSACVRRLLPHCTWKAEVTWCGELHHTSGSLPRSVPARACRPTSLARHAVAASVRSYCNGPQGPSRGRYVRVARTEERTAESTACVPSLLA